MKKLIFSIFAAITISLFAIGANAQMPALSRVEGMGNLSNTQVDWNEIVEHTAREEQEGKALWDKLQAKEVICTDLNDEQFDVLGEYFMGTMMGDSHASMNAMMIQAHGEEGEEQIHIVMGKRLSGCDTSAIVPGISGGWMPMMNMMTGGWSFDGIQDRSSLFGFNSTDNMMNFGFGAFSFFGWIFMILWWVLIIAGIVALIKWLTSQSHGARGQGKPASPAGGSALEILKERYAKGEIDKKEFEEKKRDLI